MFGSAPFISPSRLPHHSALVPPSEVLLDPFSSSMPFSCEGVLQLNSESYLPPHCGGGEGDIIIIIMIMINILMPAPTIVLHIKESYWYSKHRSIVTSWPNLTNVVD
jgi:hypothetical protein